MTAKATTGQTFEGNVKKHIKKKKVVLFLKRFNHKPEEVDCLKIAHQFYFQTLSSGVTIMGPTTQLKPRITSAENKCKMKPFFLNASLCLVPL